MSENDSSTPAPEAAPARRAPRRRATSPTAPPPAAESAPATAPAESAPTPVQDRAGDPGAVTDGGTDAATGTADDAAPVKPRRTRAPRATAAPAAGEEPASPAPTKARRRTAKADPVEPPENTAPTEPAPDAGPATTDEVGTDAPEAGTAPAPDAPPTKAPPRRRTKATGEDNATPAVAADADAPAPDEDAPAPAKARRTRKPRTAQPEPSATEADPAGAVSTEADEPATVEPGTAPTEPEDAATSAPTDADVAEPAEDAAEPAEGAAEPQEDAAEPATEPAEAAAESPVAAETEAPAPKSRRRAGTTARAPRTEAVPPRSPEQTIDVLAELGMARSDAAPAADSTAPAPAEDEKPARRRRSRAETADRAEPSAPVDAAPASGTDDPAEDMAEEPADEGPRLPASALLFQGPEPARGRARRRKAAPDAEPVTEPTDTEPADTEPADTDAEPADEALPAEVSEAEEGADADGTEDESTSQRRRRRRGGRGRRNRTGPRDQGDDVEADDEAKAQPEDLPAEDAAAEAAPAAGDEDSEDDADAGHRRRRRRRSRGDGDGTPPAREPRPARDEVTALKGSTRLEAKRQRRREGRDAGRRRTTITESEFLARRESVDRSMVVREKAGRTQIAVLEDGVLVEHYVAQKTQSSMVGNVYLGRVQNVLPSMEAAFIDIGKGRNAVLYAGEVNWDAAGMEGQPRRIEQALSSGDAVLVQVTKDPIGHKGARLTAQITLAGRYLVLVPSGAMTGISRKLPENERARLKKLLKEIVPAGSGVIVRTAAEGATEEQLRADVERLTAQWAEIEKKQSNAKSAPVLLRGEPELAVRVVRDVFNEDFSSLTVSGNEAWDTISSYVLSLAPDLADRIHHWTQPQDVFSAHRIDEQLVKGMDRKVWLPSGGSLVIDRTEAMTVVDVNTGKFTGSGGTLEETVTRNNLEAAEEVVRQLRLRDIGGIIVIDFIDMVLESNRELVLRRLVECLGRDRTRHQVAEVTSLGLVQMTRKRVGQGLVEAFSETCEHCNGRGFLVHTDPVERPADGSEDAGSGGRKRGGRRGGDEGHTSRPAAPSAPAPAEPRPAEDPQAVAAREAVKATLAAIAAAAAHAHDDDRPAEQPAPSGGQPSAPAERADAGTDEAAAPVAPAGQARESDAVRGTAAPAPATTAPPSNDGPGSGDVPAGEGSRVRESRVEEPRAEEPRKRRPRRASSSGRAPGGEAAGGAMTVPAAAAPTATVPAAAAPTSTSPAGPAVPEQAGAPAGAFTPPPAATADGTGSTDGAAADAAPRRARRSRRATSGGPVTA